MEKNTNIFSYDFYAVNDRNDFDDICMFLNIPIFIPVDL